jgi:hypothetical protein
LFRRQRTLPAGGSDQLDFGTVADTIGMVARRFQIKSQPAKIRCRRLPAPDPTRKSKAPHQRRGKLRKPQSQKFFASFFQKRRPYFPTLS